MRSYVYVDMARVGRKEPGLVIRAENEDRHQVRYAYRVELAPGVALVQRDSRCPIDGTMVRIETDSALTVLPPEETYP